MTVRIATRGTPLARWQAERVAGMLGTDAELVVVTTTGDARPDTPIRAMGGTGMFVKEVQEALLTGHADVAVHSAKDLPSGAGPDGLLLAAFPERADPRDALVGSTLAGLKPGATVATGAVRRRAQLAAVHPALQFAELRGSIGTRLEKAAGFDAIVVAAAALERLGLLDAATELLDPSVMMPQVGQGALAVECRADDHESLERVSVINDPYVAREVAAERAFLEGLGSVGGRAAGTGGGCDLPCGAYATHDGDEIVVQGLLASVDGRTVLRGTERATDPEHAGRLLVRALLDHGGAELIEQVSE